LHLAGHGEGAPDRLARAAWAIGVPGLDDLGRRGAAGTRLSSPQECTPGRAPAHRAASMQTRALCSVVHVPHGPGWCLLSQTWCTSHPYR
ncbi:hypothetical protein ACWEN3_39455, partial [Streptomyces sp. NPDC004561]